MLKGTAAATLHKCLVVSTGRGDYSQYIDRFGGRGPSVLRGSCPAIAVSFASRLALDASMISGNKGLPVQYRDALEQAGIPSCGGGFGHRRPIRALATLAEQEARVEEIMEDRNEIRDDQMPARPNEREEELQSRR